MQKRGSDKESLANASERNVQTKIDNAEAHGEGYEKSSRTRSPLEQEAHAVAAAMRLAAKPARSHLLLEHIPHITRQLETAHRRFMAEAGHAWIGSYAGEWMLDNFHSVRQTLRQIKKDLPPKFYRELPKLAEPVEARGLPRIYELVRAYVAHEQYQFSMDSFAQFLAAAEVALVSADSQQYDSTMHFSIGEVWAAPIMLRIVLVESLADAALQSTESDRVDEPDFAQSQEPSVRAADIVAHCIQSLRRIDTQDWDAFFERVSRVHAILCGDPSGVYPFMDFATRDRYRGAVERIARRGAFDEVSVARAAIDLATDAARVCGDSEPHEGAVETLSHTREFDDGFPSIDLDLPRTCHVGHYLVDAGQRRLERQVRYRPTVMERIERFVRAQATLVYLGSIGLFTLAVLAAIGWYIRQVGPEGSTGWLATAGAGLLLLVPAMTMAVNLVNWLVTHTIAPQILPKLDFAKGIPSTCRTMVVIPALISHVSDVDFLIRQLELHYLRNPDRNLGFALLGDLADAPECTMSEDASLITATTAAVEALNRKYAGEPFFLFHRERRWNPAQEVWMGWERKRGNLHQFNRMLRLGPDSVDDNSYLVKLGRLELLEHVRYVITLDADTMLPADAAHRLVGTLAHPLNRAGFDPESGRAVAGYTILQPRAEIKPTIANHSLFTRIFAADTGIDLYTLAVSDVYQDLFGAGIFVGKGIYDVEAYERSMEGRVPENALLSHDLFEGIHGRVGLVTDIVIFEDFPPHYVVNVLRSHRWIRGDWQLLPWLMAHTPRVGAAQSAPFARADSPDAARTAVELAPNDLALIDLWKIVDNLLRSLFAPTLLLLFVLGWTILPGSPIAWTLIGLAISTSNVVAGLLSLLADLLRRSDNSARLGSLRSLRYSALRWLLFLAFLPHETLLAVDAIARTLYRLFVSRKNLLEWTTAARTVRLFGDEVTQEVALRQMWPSVAMVAVLTLIIGVLEASAFPLALPFLVIWLLSWEIAYRLSLSPVPWVAPLDEDERVRLRKLARRTWLFYEEFVGPRDNWLPPDHFQEFPRGAIARYTSPTNVGMYIVSLLAAHDLGYIGPSDLSMRLRFLFATLARLERYRGHFLNWTNTENLVSLPPRYVSTVDSGNLAACLIVLKQTCLNIGARLLWTWLWWQGLLDTVSLLEDVLIGGQFTSLESPGDLGPAAPSGAATDAARSLLEHLQAMRGGILAVRNEPHQWFPLLLQLARVERQELQRRLLELFEDPQVSMNAESLHTCRILVDRIRHHLDAMMRASETLQSWLVLGTDLPQRFTSSAETAGEDALLAAWDALAVDLAPVASLQEIASVNRRSKQRLSHIEKLLDEANDSAQVEEARAWAARLRERLAAAETAANDLLDQFGEVAQIADTYLREMDFSFLFDMGRQVFHIGYNVESGILDNSYYDLLASEARVASLIAIARHDVPQSHWLHLGRPLTSVESEEQTLLSWSGTMFEYLMPTLLARNYPGTLLDQSVRGAIREQMEYGKKTGVPWGISESGFYAFDSARNYQYRAFGVPTLGFKRGLADDLVIAPYASLLALPTQPHDVLKNLDELEQLGLLGRYGFYEAVDFTHSRLDFGARYGIVRSYMAHHQGMIMLALADALHGNRMVERFHREPMIQAVELLLQEQIPTGAPLQFPYREQSEAPLLRDASVQPQSADSWRASPDTDNPHVHVLSNGRYGLILGATGSGFSRWNDLQLTRWRSDPTLEEHGAWLYVQELLQDGAAHKLWSTTRQPMCVPPDHEEITFHPHMIEFRRRDVAVTSHTRVTVSVDDDVELRIVTLTNDSDEARRLRIVSYGEVVLAAPAADLRHPAFVKLFVESEFLAEERALLFRRRPRGADEDAHCLAHALIVRPEQPGITWGTLSYESDRMRFIGRDRDQRSPAALAGNGAGNGGGLTGTTGATLDPIFALSQEVELAPHANAELALLTMAGKSRRALREYLMQYRSWAEIEGAFARANVQAAQEARTLGLEGSLLEMFSRLLSLLLYPDAVRRAAPSVLASNRRGQNGLWAYGISGDHPILLVRIGDESEGELLHQVLKAHIYWRRRNLKIDVVILNRQETNYGQGVRGFIMRLIQRTGSQNWLGQPGGLFVLAQDQLDDDGRVLLQTVARVILDGDRGLLEEQLGDWFRRQRRLPDLFPVPTAIEQATEENDGATPPIARPDDLQFDNGIGGFSADGKEYVVYLSPGMTDPAPWINVVANPAFGFLVSASGSGYTWAINSGENRLTTWHNDPVSNPPAEAIYLRDEETAKLWSPTAQPAPAPAPYLARHGAGYSCFEHNSHGLEQKLRLFAVIDAPVKVAHLRLKNLTPRPRRITVTYYAEWVLGGQRDETQQYIVPEYEGELGALLARNSYSAEFSERVAFLAGSKETHGLTTDRTEFLGRCGSLRRPVALTRIGLSNRVEAGLDPCAALQLHVDLAPEAEAEVYFLIGQGANRNETLDLIRKFRKPEEVTAAWQAVHKFWDDTLGAVTVQTPDPAMNLLLNRWLMLQTLVCRVWGRSALYQSSGAFGFRDQLQDVMALVHTRPDLTREHILAAARHQFESGDVLHWWHPPSSRGLRTHISDNLLWLPYVTAHYIKATGDATILEEEIPFLVGEPLAIREEEKYGQFEETKSGHTLYEHCRRAIEKGATAGPHGIPLIGAGDWNDGMNRVGIHGRGESIWLGWFLYATLNEFANVCERTGRMAHGAEFRERAKHVRDAVEEHGWDGQWYLRAYDDEGVPLGSAQNVECRIDAIAQSWSVLSGAGDPQRRKQAMASALKWLVKWDDRLILLLTPPFDKAPRDPGYIKGYVPGIRENGGQYTHAALWTMWAFAKLGDNTLPEQLFRLINPIYRADSPEKAAHYRVEPYVIAADVYGVSPHTGRGGWTWYTGSAGWMYRLGVEGILGLVREHRDGVPHIRIDPRIPDDWPFFQVTYRVGATVYEMHVDNRAAFGTERNGRMAEFLLDGAELTDKAIPLLEDGKNHQVHIMLRKQE